MNMKQLERHLDGHTVEHINIVSYDIGNNHYHCQSAL